MALRVTESGALRSTESGVQRITESTEFSGLFWPLSLKQSFVLGTYRQSRPNTVLRSNPEAGPAIVRQRFTAAPSPFSGSMIFDMQQYQTYRDFFDNSAMGGYAVFFFPAQDGSDDYWDVRFTKEPTEERITATHWRVSFEMEKLP